MEPRDPSRDGRRTARPLLKSIGVLCWAEGLHEGARGRREGEPRQLLINTQDVAWLTFSSSLRPQTIELNPGFAKGYGRKGGALHGARRFDESVKAFEEGLKIAPTDAGLKKGLEEVQKAQESDGPGGQMGKMFQDPQLFQKLAANPKTASLLADQSFVQKLNALQKNPNDAMSAFQDP